ncbi:MAG TPA: hypothetical protein VIJ15_05410 [Dermatophilaceae bacterium]
MTIAKDIRKTVSDTTPVYAAVGVTDLAVERLREARVRATTRVTAVQLDLNLSTMQEKAVKRFEKATEQVQQIPAQFRSQTVEAADKAKETYSELAVRGEKLVNRIRNQKSTKDLLAQAGNTVSLGKGAVTTVRNAAHDTQHAAAVTLATGRREASAVAASVQEDVKATGHKAAVATHAAADDTVATAKKSTASAERAARSAVTSARKTAAAAAAATKTATSKVGD